MPDAMIDLLTGCGAGGVLSDASGSRMERSILDREGSADLHLTEGDRMRVSLSHTEGSVDVIVRLEDRSRSAGETGSRTPNLFSRSRKQETILSLFRDIGRKAMSLSPGSPEGRNKTEEKLGGTKMLFKGIGRTFSTENDRQYETIGAFWDELAAKYGRVDLQGLGYGWKERTIEYAIGLIDGEIDGADRAVKLPDTGWVTVRGRTADLGKIYEKIYQKGRLDYEIERFTDSGDCEIMYCRSTDRDK